MLKFKFLTRHIWQILEITFCPFEKPNKTEFECWIMEISLLGTQEFYGISPSFMYTFIRCEKRKDKWMGAKGGNQSSKLCYNPDMRRVGLRLGCWWWEITSEKRRRLQKGRANGIVPRHCYMLGMGGKGKLKADWSFQVQWEWRCIERNMET